LPGPKRCDERLNPRGVLTDFKLEFVLFRKLPAPGHSRKRTALANGADPSAKVFYQIFLHLAPQQLQPPIDHRNSRWGTGVQYVQHFQNRQAGAKILADRSSALTAMLTNAGLDVEISPADVMGLPAAVIGAMGTPAIGSAPLAYEVGNGLIGLGAAGFDYYLAGQNYKTELTGLGVCREGAYANFSRRNRLLCGWVHAQRFRLKSPLRVLVRVNRAEV
jgi:hypothetical protein